MLAEKILSSPEVFELAAQIAKSKTVGEFQSLCLTLEELFIARTLDLQSRGIPDTVKFSLVLDLHRLFAGYLDFRFATSLSIQSFYNTNAGDWFAYYKVPTSRAAIWHHVSSSEKGILSGALADKLIEAKQLIRDDPNFYLNLLKEYLVEPS